MRLICFVIFFAPSLLKSQDSLPLTVQSYKAFTHSVKARPGFEMIDIRKAVPFIQLDLKYCSSNNFTGKKLYPDLTTTYCRTNMAIALKKVQEALLKEGKGLKIFDAYRPFAVTVIMWEAVKDERYAASPYKGSGHNRGVAVDCTIIELATGKEVDMGTGFDNFTDSAHHGFSNLPAPVLQNRLLLRKLMEEQGLNALETEWWHYSLKDAAAYDLLNLSFDELAKHL